MTKPFTTDEVIRAVSLKFAELRSELSADIAQLRDQIGGCRSDIVVLREEIDEYGNVFKNPIPGPAGPPGERGEKGDKGDPGYAGQARGQYQPAESYRAMDVVAHNGSEWRAKVDNPGPLPGDGWHLGAKGSRGKRGERGPAGPSGQPPAMVTSAVISPDVSGMR